MSYLALARKYRPQNFNEIVGQEHIATTLKNAISMDMVAHAYLFTGPRGVGKTSTARILAKSLNCEKGPTSKPCDKCISCKEISEGRGMDVIEIDGASNRGIDEIRNLKENIRFASIHGKFRIYIIDEVHMLTQEAFNALLKTLEEPPKHAKFIFATTRPYKVLPTIVSRCQRFDFRKIPTQDIAKKLEDIKSLEKLNVENNAVFLISKAADGSLRDAEVILDQLLSFTKGKIKAEDVTKVLGLLEQNILFDLTDALSKNEKENVLTILNSLIDSGKDPIFIAQSIINHFRNLLVIKVSSKDSKAQVGLSEEDHDRLVEQAKNFSIDDILYATYALSGAIDLIKKTALGRIPLEICLIKLTEKDRLLSLKEILGKLSSFKGTAKVEKVELKPSLPTTPIIKTEEKPVEEVKEIPVEVKPEEISQEKDILLLQKIKTSWLNVINFVKAKKMSLGTFLSEGKLLKVKGNTLEIGFYKNNSLHKEAVEENANRKFVEEVIKNITGQDVLVNTGSIEGEPKKENTAIATEEKIEEAVEAKSNKIDPIVESALDAFDGRVVNIRENVDKEKK